MSFQLRHEFIHNFYIINILISIYNCKSFHIRLFKYIFQLMTFISRVNGDKNRSNFGCCKHEGKPIRHVFGPYTNIIPLNDAQWQKTLCEHVNTFIKIFISKSKVPVRIDYKISVRILINLFFKEISYGILCKKHFFTPKSLFWVIIFTFKLY